MSLDPVAVREHVAALATAAHSLIPPELKALARACEVSKVVLNLGTEAPEESLDTVFVGTPIRGLA